MTVFVPNEQRIMMNLKNNQEEDCGPPSSGGRGIRSCSLHGRGTADTHEQGVLLLFITRV